MFFRTPFNYDVDAVSKETGLLCEDESLAVQSERDECDINTIVARFGLTGSLPQNVRAPSYGDFVGIGDYREALEAIEEANASFYAMPAEVRTRFNNNPAEFVDFCSSPLNLNEMKKMGLLSNPPSAESFAGQPANVSGEAPAAGDAQ